ncbi:MAG: hypothetical protein WB475_10440, partial [Pseudolabrys sp.]
VVSRYVPENLADVDQATTNIEGAIRDVLRRDTRFPRQQRAEVDADAHRGVEGQEALILRVANASTEEIDRLIFELQSVRDMLRREGERVNRDLASYASLNQHLMTGMKIISENLRQWKGAPESREQAIADFKLRWLTQD